MTDKEYISMLQKDPLYRELPGLGDERLAGDRFAGKLAVAAALGLLLAAAGGLTDARRDHSALSTIVPPGAAAPPAIVVDAQPRHGLAAR